MPNLAPVYRGLAALHRAGVGWPEALDAVTVAGPGWAAARARLAAGEPLSAALHGVVPGLDLAFVAAGEAGGNLETALETLAQRHEEEHRRRGQRRTALAYPVLVAHIAALLLPIPDLAQGRLLAAAFWAVLPLLPVYGLLLLRPLGAAGSGPLPHRFPHTDRVELADAQALEALGALYDAGVPLLQALPLAAAAGPRGRAAADLARAAERVRAGHDLAGAWRELPPGLSAGLVNAERAGALGRECRAVAERLSFDVEMRTRRRTARLAPLLVLALGAIVGLRVIAFYAAAFRQATLR